jgi:putative component of toxin-antitoxin plasmid stabilization module
MADDPYKQGALVLLLLGGNKNSQSRDISRAKKMIKDIEDEKV